MREAKPRVFLTGAFRIEDAAGVRIPLTSAKAQGLLAMVLTSPNGECGRALLQQRLWSDRGPEQASGSLRQVLSALRRLLEPAGVPFEVERQSVRIDLDGIDIVDRPDWVFLEGIKVRDPAFEAWVAGQRYKRQPVSSAPIHSGHDDADDAWRVSIVMRAKASTSDRWFESLFSDALSRSLREIFSAPVSVGDQERVSAGLLTVRVEGFPAGAGGMALRVSVDHPARNHQVWSGHRVIPLRGAPQIDHPDLLRLVNDLVEALGDYLILIGKESQTPTDPDRICRLALRSLFTMSPERLLDADRDFERAFEMQPRGLYLAWRAQLRAIQSVERHEIDAETVAEEGRYFCARALELEPGNSMVLATLSNAMRRFDRDDQRSLAIAQRSVQLNPANPMAWWAYCAANSYVGHETTSLRAGILARRLALLSPHRFWWDNQRFVPSLLEGDLARALELAEQAHTGNPNFRPPLRHLVALYANSGRNAEALAAAKKLKALEPDFEVERLIRDTDYPSSILRRIPQLDRARVLSVD